MDYTQSMERRSLVTSPGVNILYVPPPKLQRRNPPKDSKSRRPSASLTNDARRIIGTGIRTLLT